MARPTTPAIAALATAAYFLLSVGILASFNLGLPPQLERVLSIVAAPALFLLAIWTPILRPLGLAGGEWVAAPTLPGALLLIALYAVLAYLATALALRLFRRER
jgi:hypothetical protein